MISKEYQQVLGALYCLRYLFQRYEYEKFHNRIFSICSFSLKIFSSFFRFLTLDEMGTRKYFEVVIEKVLPVLLQIFNFSLNVNLIESAEIMTVITKILWSITQV